MTFLNLDFACLQYKGIGNIEGLLHIKNEAKLAKL